MTPEQISENVKRLREIDSAFEGMPTVSLMARDAIRASHHQLSIQTINALVQLVGEMHADNIILVRKWAACQCGIGSDGYFEMIKKRTNTKAVPIAALAKEEK